MKTMLAALSALALTLSAAHAESTASASDDVNASIEMHAISSGNFKTLKLPKAPASMKHRIWTPDASLQTDWSGNDNVG